MPVTNCHVAFVRAVMIGREGLDRDVLLGMFDGAGADDAVSHLATGNVSFRAPTGDVGRIVGAVESALLTLLDRPTPLFVRPLDRLVELVDAAPFGRAPFAEIHARLVTFFTGAVPPSIEVPLTAANGDWSVFAADHAELFSVTRAWRDRQPNDPGGVIQRVAGEPVTTRAIGTIERIVTKLAAPEP